MGGYGQFRGEWVKIVLNVFLSDRMVHYVQFLGETVNTFLTDLERGWRGII